MTGPKVPSPANRTCRAVTLLIGLGGLSLPLYVALAWLSFDFEYGTGHADRPLLAVLGLFATATGCYLTALGYLLCTHRPDGVYKANNGPLTVILGFALAFRLALFFSVPIQEIDYYRYLWDGRVCLEGANPYWYSPAQIDEAATLAPGSEAHALWRISQRSPALATIFVRVHHREVPTVYPPAAQWVFATAALLTPAEAPLWAHVGILKALLLAFDVGTVFLLVGLLRQLNLPSVWCLAYAWCPLTVKEFANSAHLDSVAIFFCTLALYCLVRFAKGEGCEAKKGGNRRPAVFSRKWATGGLAALGVAVLAKSYPLILLPVVAGCLLSRLRVRALAPLGACALVVATGYLPFVPSGSVNESVPVQGVSPPTQLAVEGHHPFSGLGTFLTRWQMNDLLFMVAHENLRRPAPVASDRWFVVVPGAWREGLNGFLVRFGPPEGTDPAFLLSQGLMGMLLFGLALYWAHGVWRDPIPPVLLRGCFLVLVWGWLLSSAQNPWYLLWALPLMIFEGRLSWFLLPGLALLYYLRFHMEYQALGSAQEFERAQERFDFGVVWFEFAPFFALLLAETMWRKRRPAHPLPSPPDSSGG